MKSDTRLPQRHEENRMSSTLTPAQRAMFEEQGYLHLGAVVPEHLLRALEHEYGTVLEEIALQSGVAWSAARPFAANYLDLLNRVPDLPQRVDITLPVVHNLRPDSPIHTGPSVFDLITHPALLDAVESLVGPEIEANPIQHMRLKPRARAVPEASTTNTNVGTTTWHQDGAVVTPDADDTPMVTVWGAVSDATIENGCLICIPGSHRRNPPLVRHEREPGREGEISIRDDLLRPYLAVPLPVQRGDVVLLHRHLVHASHPNRTDSVRWSFDLRYQPAGRPSGRCMFPSFVVRSRRDPRSIVSGPAAWARGWYAARERICRGEVAVRFNNRWDQPEVGQLPNTEPGVG